MYTPYTIVIYLSILSLYFSNQVTEYQRLCRSGRVTHDFIVGITYREIVKEMMPNVYVLSFNGDIQASQVSMCYCLM